MLSEKRPAEMLSEVVKIQLFKFQDGRMDTKNAARFLGLSPKTLANMRTKGTGPRFTKRGRIFYYEEDLREWLAAQPRTRSSTEARLASARHPTGKDETRHER